MHPKMPNSHLSYKDNYLKSYKDSLTFIANNKFREIKSKKAKEELEKSILKALNKLCQTKMLKTNISEAKETSREGKQTKDSFNIDLN